MTPRPDDPRSTPLVGGAALLGIVGALGLFAPVAATVTVAFVLGNITSASWTTGILLERLGVALSWTSIVSGLALVAGLGLYRRRAWARHLGRLVAGLLLTGVAFEAISRADPEAGRVEPLASLVDRVAYQLFLVLPADPRLVGAVGPVAILLGLVGATLLVSLAAGPRSATNPGPTGEGPAGAGPTGARARPGRRLEVAAAILAIVAAEALLPVAVLLGALVVPWGVATQLDGPSSSAGVARAVVVGGPALVAVAVPSGIAALVAITAALAIRRGMAAAPYLAPAAAVVAIFWATPWLTLLVGLTGVPVAAIILLVIASGSVVFAAGATVGAWRQFPLASSTGPLLARPSRRLAGVAGLVGVAAVALTVTLPASGSAGTPSCVDECAEVETLTLWLGDRQYSAYGALAAADGTDLEVVGSLDDWSPDVAVADPTAFAIVGIDPGQALLVRSSRSTDQEGRTFEYILAMGDSAAGDLPRQLCERVSFEDSNVPGGTCGPPELIAVGGRDYLGSPDFQVPPSRVTPTGEIGTGRFKWFWYAGETDVAVEAIDGVDPGMAVAIRFHERVVVYLDAALGDANELPPALCAYAGDSSGVGKGCSG